MYAVQKDLKNSPSQINLAKNTLLIIAVAPGLGISDVLAGEELSVEVSSCLRSEWH